MNETAISKKREAAVSAMAALIRERSEGGALVSQDELIRHVSEQQFFKSQAQNPVGEIRTIFDKLILENEDLQQCAATEGSLCYYSSRSMSRTYAGLRLHKQADPLRLIAEHVRQNSAVYVRPMPLEIFTQAPFDFSDQQMMDYLKQMAEIEGYRDVMPIKTSGARVFLYSRLHLDPEHALMLAEWLDVGQFENP